MSKHTYLPHLRDYKDGIVWALLDAIGSQGLVILYHLIFRTVSEPSLHGTMSCLLSTMYLAIAVSNLGLDKTLAPFLESISHSKRSFRSFLLTIIVPQLMLITLLSLVGYGSYHLTKELPLMLGLSSYLSTPLVLTVLLTFILESIRKIARTFLQLSFYFELTTIIELIGITLNVIGIGMLYNFSELTLLASWQLLAGTALLQLTLLSAGIVHIYTSLPENSSQQNPELLTRFTKTRLFSWVLQCLSQLYSGNFLVPICALQFGVASASLMQVITSISYWITLLAKRVFGITSNALLAHVKSQSAETQTEAFSYVTEVFNQGVVSVLIILLINGKKLATVLYEAPQEVTWSLLYVMVLLTFFESFFVLYEKWYILEEDAQTYLAFTLTSVGLVYLVTRTLSSPLSILLSIISIRVLTFASLMVYSLYRWQIWPSFKPHWNTLLTALVVSLFVHLLL